MWPVVGAISVVFFSYYNNTFSFDYLEAIEKWIPCKQNTREVQIWQISFTVNF